MNDINEDFKEAAKKGDEAGLKALLLSSRFDPASKDGGGMTALMWAAWGGNASCVELLLPVSDALAKDGGELTALMYAASYGHDSCVQLLMPASDALAKDRNGHTASSLARARGRELLAVFIDAYTLALGEMSVLGTLVAPGAPRKKPALRV